MMISEGRTFENPCTCDSCGQEHNRQKPSTLSAFETIEAFCNSASFHVALEKQFAIPAHDKYQIAIGSEHQEKDFFNRLVLAASFRKFVIDSKEPVYLPTVLAALTELGFLNATAEEQHKYRKDLNDMKRGELALGRFNVGDGREWTAWQVVDALLNGLFLHADQRVAWDAIKWTSWMRDQSLFEWLAVSRSTFLGLYKTAEDALQFLHGKKPDDKPVTELRSPWG